MGIFAIFIYSRETQSLIVVDDLIIWRINRGPLCGCTSSVKMTTTFSLSRPELPAVQGRRRSQLRVAARRCVSLTLSRAVIKRARFRNCRLDDGITYVVSDNHDVTSSCRTPEKTRERPARHRKIKLPEEGDEIPLLVYNKLLYTLSYAKSRIRNIIKRNTSENRKLVFRKIQNINGM